jgi:histidinol phosphatase-like enzyme
MAIGTITPVTSFVIGDRWMKIFNVVGAASYTTGGDVLTPTQLGFVIGDAEFQVSAENSNGVDASYDYANQKLKCYSGAAEATAASNLSTSVFRVTAIGKYTT